MKTLGVVFLLAVQLAVAGDDNTAKIRELFETRSTTSYPAAAFTAPMALAAGQWVRYGMTDDDGDRTVMTTKIIAVSNGEVTIETEALLEDDVMVMQFTLKGMEAARTKGNIDELEFVRIKIKSGTDDVMVIDGFMLSMAKAAYSKALKGIVDKPTIAGDGGTIAVSAGTFNGTTKVESQTAPTGDEEKTISFLHPSVPVYGVVKSIANDEFTMELLAFGTSGARSALD